MARKKKANVEFEPSEYQKNIFKFVTEGNGNLVVEACAGSGKTYTLLKSLKLIDTDKKILLTAFNKDIVSVLKRKTKDMPNVTVITLHGLGLLMLQRNFKDERLGLDEYKYKSYINTNIRELSSINVNCMDKKTYLKYTGNISKYVDFGRYYLCQTVSDMRMIEERYGIDTIADEKAIAIEVMEWGKSHLSDIDYTDMVWLPNILYCQPIGLKFDWIGLDECQDLNKAQRELLLKCRKINTRIMSYGDDNQCIYSFSGADPDSFKEMKNIPNTTSLPLSISYRCADDIVDYAKNIVKSIERNNDGRKGVIEKESTIDSLADGDMVICRNNAPLMYVYTELIKKGVKCFIRGKEIGAGLKTAIRATKQDKLSKDLMSDGVFPRLYLDLFETRDKLMEKNNIDISTAMESSSFTNKLDSINSLEILSDGINTTQELIERIDNVFSNRKTGGVALSTIHKAKGLEADNVYVACDSLMPSKNASKDWEILQERNLMYVAYTRAKNKLSFLDEKPFEKFVSDGRKMQSQLLGIESKVNSIYGRKMSYSSTDKTYAEMIVRRAKPIEKPKSNNRQFSVGNIQPTNRKSLNTITKNKPLKITKDSILWEKLRK